MSAAEHIDITRIMELIPHRYPLLLVDRILDYKEGEYAVGLKNVTMNEPQFQGHFPNFPVMPGVLIVEAMAQCAAVLFLREIEDREPDADELSVRAGREPLHRADTPQS